MEQTIFEILNGRYIIFGDSELGMIITWNLSATFQVFRSAGGGLWYETDSWNTEIIPKDLQEAVRRCYDRMPTIREELSADDLFQMESSS